MENESIKYTADQKIEQLNKIYDRYKLRYEKEKPNPLSKIFGGKSPYDHINMRFIEDLEECIEETAETLAHIKETDQALSEDYARRILDILYADKPKKQETDYERYLYVAEYYGFAIFPYATQEVLNEVRNAVLERTPRKHMFPRQLEMVNMLDELILMN